MSQRDSELEDILHELDHQKFEAIGIERLSEDAKVMMSAILFLLRTANLSSAQDLAVLSTLLETLQEKSCSKCLALSDRLKRHMIAEYNTYEKKKGKR